jgi:pyruvate/2-oxoglutarate dehydrogenase complex dihydrolipoamide dehydrogenase (E3) component
MKKYDYNVIVIGAGSAGLVSSYIAAAVKAKVALIEKNKMGGDCLNTGCVPSKALIRSAKIISYINRAKEFGFTTASVDFEFSKVMDRVHSIIKQIEPHDSVERYTELGVDCYQEEAKIISPHEVRLGSKILTARSIIVASGASPLIPDIPGLDSVSYLTSDTIWDLKELPERLVVLGGGPIGSEIAQAFQRLGSSVVMVERSAHILSREDQEVSQFLEEEFKREGIQILTRHSATEFTSENGVHKIICEHDGKKVAIEFDSVLVALGRKARTEGFGLEELGVKISTRGTIETNPYLQTNIPSIYVCGDVAGPYQFTHSAAHQAWYAATNALFSPLKKSKVDYRIIPWTTFTDPEVAHVGVNEREATEQNISFETSVYEISDLDRAIADSSAKGFIKVLTPPGKDKILGVTIVGPHAGDLLAEYVLAMKHGIGLNKILGTIHVYPTLAEANKFVAGVWRRKNTPAFLLKLLEKFHSWRR